MFGHPFQAVVIFYVPVHAVGYFYNFEFSEPVIGQLAQLLHHLNQQWIVALNFTLAPVVLVLDFVEVVMPGYQTIVSGYCNQSHFADFGQTHNGLVTETKPTVAVVDNYLHHNSIIDYFRAFVKSRVGP
jgi:hypothetical protein